MRYFGEAGRHCRWSCMRWSSPTTVAKRREEEVPRLARSAMTAGWASIEPSQSCTAAFLEARSSVMSIHWLVVMFLFISMSRGHTAYLKMSRPAGMRDDRGVEISRILLPSKETRKWLRIHPFGRI